MVSTTNIHWLAGLLEGEGCFTSYHNVRILIALNMCDRDVVSRAAKPKLTWTQEEFIEDRQIEHDVSEELYRRLKNRGVIV